jgi:hypothetical protein
LARSERGTRRVVGVLFMVAGGLTAAIGGAAAVAIAARRDEAGADHTRLLAESSLFFVLGTVYVVSGAYMVAVEGPVESALHAYELGGRRKSVATFSMVPRLVLVPGGGIAGFGGSF